MKDGRMALLVVALTGGIATGKSVVAKVLEQHGCYIHSADRVAHDLMKPGRPAWKQIISHFGRRVLNADQTINRARLGAIVFREAKERRFLNALIHPLVLKQKEQVIRRLEKIASRKIFISEAALTLEAGFGPFFDKVIVVHCPEDVQVKRLMRRDKISRREALRKIRSQMPGEEKRRHADYLIDTSGSLGDTFRQTEGVYQRLLADYRNKMKREKRKTSTGTKPTRQRPKAGS
jgi:dephospho-CoA kinase